MDSEHKYYITVAVPEFLAHEGNSLALCLGQQPRDDETFVSFDHVIGQDPDTETWPTYKYPTRVSVASTLVTEAFMQDVEGTDPIAAPSYRPDADTAAAERGRAALRLTGKMTENTIGARPEIVSSEVLEGIGVAVFEWEPINVNFCEIEWLNALDGVGPALAQKIVDARPFGTVDEMTRVSGVSQSMVDAWGWRITA